MGILVGQREPTCGHSLPPINENGWPNGPMLNGESGDVLRKINGERPNALPGDRCGQLRCWQDGAEPDPLTLFSGDSFSLFDRVSGTSRCGYVVVRETATRRPAESALKRHGLAAQREELPNVRLEFRLGELRRQIEQHEQDVVFASRLSEQIGNGPPVDRGELRKFVSRDRSIPQFDLRDYRPGQTGAFGSHLLTDAAVFPCGPKLLR